MLTNHGTSTEQHFLIEEAAIELWRNCFENVDSRRMTWTEHVAYVAKKRNTYMALVGNQKDSDHHH
jgi:hypothetical protein